AAHTLLGEAIGGERDVGREVEAHAVGVAEAVPATDQDFEAGGETDHRNTCIEIVGDNKRALLAGGVPRQLDITALVVTTAGRESRVAIDRSIGWKAGVEIA